MAVRALLFAGLIFVFTGCRFGNNVDTGPGQYAVTYYGTQPQAAVLCATLAGEADTRCENTTPNNIPKVVSQVISNPVGLFHFLESDEFLMYDPMSTSSSKPAMPTYVKNNKISYAGKSGDATVWRDAACKVRSELYHDGDVNPNIKE